MKNPTPMARCATRNPFDLTFRSLTCFLAVLSLIFLPFSASAQSYSQVPVNEYGYTVTVPNVVLDEGQSVEVIVSLGAFVHDVAGFKLTVDLGDGAARSSSLHPNVNGSWIRENGVTVAESIENGKFVYAYERTTTVNGTGELLRLRLTAATDDVHAADLLSQSGGVLIVDNLDIRQAAPAPELQLWPNPTTGTCQVRCADAVASIKILSVNGQSLRNYGPVDMIDLTDLPAGMYFVEIANQLGHVFRRSIHKL